MSHITRPVDMPIEEVDVEAALAAYDRVFAREAAGCAQLTHADAVPPLWESGVEICTVPKR